MKKIIFIGLLSFLLAAIWQLPLSFAKPYAEKLVKGLKMEGVSGTIWNGKADRFTIKKTYLGQVSWKVKPIKSITSLSLKLTFDISGASLTATGLAGITPNQKLILDNTKFDLNATYLNKLQKYAKLAGEIKGDIQHAELDQKNIPMIKGIIDWKNGAMSSPMKLAPGDYKAIISPDSGDLLIKLSSFEAPAELNGKIKLNKEWIYNTDLNLKSSDKSITPMLGLLGKKQANGSIQIKNIGDLKPLLGKKKTTKENKETNNG